MFRVVQAYFPGSGELVSRIDVKFEDEQFCVDFREFSAEKRERLPIPKDVEGVSFAVEKHEFVSAMKNLIQKIEEND